MVSEQGEKRKDMSEGTSRSFSRRYTNSPMNMEPFVPLLMETRPVRCQNKSEAPDTNLEESSVKNTSKSTVKMASDVRYAFCAEWYDQLASIMRKYYLFFYPADNTVEMFDIKNKRSFLKRSSTNLKVDDLHIGGIINIHSRQLKITDYGDKFTKSKLKCANEKTVALIKPDAIKSIGSIIEMIDENGLKICGAGMFVLSKHEALEFLQDHAGDPDLDYCAKCLTDGPVVALELMGPDIIDCWKKVLGPQDSAAARAQSPLSVRAKFGTDNNKNAAHGSDNSAAAQREDQFFFGSQRRQNTAQCSNCTLCVIKPHAICEGKTGKIISAIQGKGFEISALQMFKLDRANAEEFHEVYKGVVNEYSSMVDELCSGPCLAMEIRGQDVPKTFREFVGPGDPEIARHLRPHTLRAKFGNDKIHNAVHCTDLPEDGQLEVEYFFKILSRS